MCHDKDNGNIMHTKTSQATKQVGIYVENNNNENKKKRKAKNGWGRKRRNWKKRGRRRHPTKKGQAKAKRDELVDCQTDWLAGIPGVWVMCYLVGSCQCFSGSGGRCSS